jgi:hypothetical protein
MFSMDGDVYTQLYLVRSAMRGVVLTLDTMRKKSAVILWQTTLWGDCVVTVDAQGMAGDEDMTLYLVVFRKQGLDDDETGRGYLHSVREAVAREETVGPNSRYVCQYADPPPGGLERHRILVGPWQEELLERNPYGEVFHVEELDMPRGRRPVTTTFAASDAHGARYTIVVIACETQYQEDGFVEFAGRVHVLGVPAEDSTPANDVCLVSKL